MSFHLAKCLDITPNGVLRPGFPQDYREYRRQHWFPLLLATTSHIRFWVDWPSLQPRRDVAFGDPANPDHYKLTGLDEQIRLANQDGLKTILIPYRYPLWVNGTQHMLTKPFVRENLTYRPAERVALSTWRAWYLDQGNPARIDQLGRAMRALEYELPAEGHGPESTWGRYVAALFDRYVAKADVHGRADYFEVVNEPNLQVFPQRSPAADTSDLGRFDVAGSELTVHRVVAEMMATMEHISRQYSPRVTCLAASTSDTDVVTAARRSTLAVNSRWPATTMPDAFVPALLEELDRIGFNAGPEWIWSYHNYNDAELGGDRVTTLRETLRGRWHGRTLDGGPMLFSTEGGIRLVRMAARLGVPVNDARFSGPIRDLQARVLGEAFHLHRRSTGVGAGVALFTQYTLNADPGFDCGLREASGAERPAYPVWCGLEEFDPHDPLPSEWRPGVKAAAPA